MGEEGGTEGGVHRYRGALIIVTEKKETTWKN
jgi:hypothetical protein